MFIITLIVTLSKEVDKDKKNKKNILFLSKNLSE